MSKPQLGKERSKAWCLTINNPNEKIDKQIELFTEDKLFQFIIFQKEKGEKRKTEHYQIYLETKKTIRGTQVKKFFPTAHIERRRGTQTQAINYCTKKESRIERSVEYGKPATQGARTDIETLTNALDEHETWKDVYNDSEIFHLLAKYGKFAQDYFNSKKSTRPKLKQLFPWQKKLIELVEKKPDSRTINWVFDVKGNRGKTELTKELVSHHGGIILGGRATTDLYQYAKSKNKVVIWDYPRASEGHVSYSSIEKIKDGYFTSTFRNPSFCARDYDAHVIIFANFLPDLDKLSFDRWNIIHLKTDEELEDRNP